MKLIENVDYIVLKKPILGVIRGKYRLIKRQRYKSNIKPEKNIEGDKFKIMSDGTIVGEVGLEWDGPTGGADTPNFMRGSLFHDILCWAVALGLLPKSIRKSIDKLLYDILSEDGMSGFRRTYVYHMIRLYVKIAY